MNKKAIPILFAFLCSLMGYSQEIILPEITSVCNKSSVVLDAGGGFNTYQWSTGATTQQITVFNNGQYSVTAHVNGEVYTATTEVEFINYTISPEQNPRVCPNNPFQFVVDPDSIHGSDYNCIWTPGEIQSNSLIITPTEEATYYVTINGEYATCYDTVSVSLHPEIRVILEQVNEFCISEYIGQVVAHVSGGEKPYIIKWNGKHQQWDSIATNLPAGFNRIHITDANDCSLDSTFWVSGIISNNADIIVYPSDTIFIQNPTVTFDFENLSDEEITNWHWTVSHDSIKYHDRSLSYTFEILKDAVLESEFEISLNIRNQSGCDTVIIKKLPIVEAELIIPNVLTPNGDGINDIFIIKNAKTNTQISREFKSVELAVYNRYGNAVYKSSNYKNDWNPQNLPDGTYFYVLRTHGYFKNDDFQGVITIIGSNSNQ